MNWLHGILTVLGETLRDVLPIVLVIVVAQLLILRQRIPHLRRVLVGFAYVILGMALFLLGLEQALFPIGKLMATQLTDSHFINGSIENIPAILRWQDYKWVYLFAAAIGFSTTIAEPALIAVATKAHQASGGAINTWGLRVAVAIGVGIGIAVGSVRIVTGTPLHYYIIGGYIIVIVQTLFAPRLIIALAYDSGGVTTSTVTVPLVTALGLGLAENVPGRSSVIDGFGLIAFAALFAIMSVMAYAQLAEWRMQRPRGKKAKMAREIEAQALPDGAATTAKDEHKVDAE
ncbi:MAG: DUF1538 domain-containing protein [Acidiferrobacterales bacterium]